MEVFNKNKVSPALFFKQHFNNKETDVIRTDPLYFIQNRDFITNVKKFKNFDLVSLIKEEEKKEREKNKKLMKRRKDFDQKKNNLDINPKNLLQ